MLRLNTGFAEEVSRRRDVNFHIENKSVGVEVLKLLDVDVTECMVPFLLGTSSDNR